MKLALAFFAAACVVILASLDWRRAVKAALVLAVLEGGIRKWLLPQASDLVYFLKDIVLLGAYVRYFLIDTTGHQVHSHAAFRALALAAVGVVALQSFNWKLGALPVGLFGLKAYLWYVPLCFMLPGLFRSAAELQLFLRRYLLLAIPVCLLGIAQFFSPPSSPLNTYVATDAVSGFGGHARITGTFSYITGHAVYLSVCFLLVLVQIASRPRLTWFLISLGEMVLLVGNMLMTGSRGPVLAGILAIIGFLPLARSGQPGRRGSPVGILALAILICATATPYLFEDAAEAFWERATNADSVADRVTHSFLAPWELAPTVGLVGYGAGATHQGGRALRERFGLAEATEPPPPAEAESVRVLLELGAAGFVVWYALRLSLLWALWKTWQNTRTPFLRHLALAAFLMHAINFSGAIVVNHTFSLYYWFFAGFIFLLPKLDASHLPLPVAPRVRTSWRRCAPRAKRRPVLAHP